MFPTNSQGDEYDGTSVLVSWSAEDRKDLWQAIVNANMQDMIYDVVGQQQPALLRDWIEHYYSQQFPGDTEAPPMMEINLGELSSETLNALRARLYETTGVVVQFPCAVAPPSMPPPPPPGAAPPAAAGKPRPRRRPADAVSVAGAPLPQKRERKRPKADGAKAPLAPSPLAQDDSSYPISVIIYDLHRSLSSSL